MLNLLTAKKRLLLITIGNPYRLDDGVGPYIADNLPELKNTVILNAEDKPERIIDDAIKSSPEVIIMIDAANFSDKPGEIKEISLDDIPTTTFSTHNFPLGALAKIMAQDTKSPVHFLGIQAKEMGFGEGLSKEIKNAADKFIKLLMEKRGVKNA